MGCAVVVIRRARWRCLMWAALDGTGQWRHDSGVRSALLLWLTITTSSCSRPSSQLIDIDAGFDAGFKTDACVPGRASDLAASRSYTSNYYFELASADLNQDGLLDLVAGQFNHNGDGFDVFFAQADGELQPPVHYDRADGNAVTVGDLDGDGLPDVVVSDGAQSGVFRIDLFLNDGRGGLGSPISYSTRQEVRGIGIADFNSDGIADLVLAESGYPSGSVELFIGQGNGVFLPPIVLPGQGTFWGGLAVADFNRDGLPDIAVSSSQANGITVLLNQGDGGFAMTSYPVPVLGQMVAISNTDGPPNLVITTGSGLQVLRNMGDGTFRAGAVYDAPGGIWVTVGDFNGDCIPDLATSAGENCGQASSGLSVLYGDSDGGFGPSVSLKVVGALPAGLAALGPIRSPRALAVGDACGAGITVYGDPSAQ